MALDQTTFSDLGGAVSDLFAGMGASDNANLKAQSDLIQAEGIQTSANGTRIQAQGTQIQSQGIAISADLLRLQAQGDLAEASEYDLAGNLANANATFTAQSTAIQQTQQDRALYQSLGTTQAGVAGAGFAESGSAMDVLRSSASQGALTRAVLGQQGLVTEAGYQEQAQTYADHVVGRASHRGGRDHHRRADRCALVRDQRLAGQQDQIAAQQDQIASQTAALAPQIIAAGQQQAAGGFHFSAIKAVAGVGELLLGGGPMQLISNVATAAGGAPENWNTSLPDGSFDGSGAF